MLQVLLRITEAVMKRPLENQRKDSFAESLASLLFRVWLNLFSLEMIGLGKMHLKCTGEKCITIL